MINEQSNDLSQLFPIDNQFTLNKRNIPVEELF